MKKIVVVALTALTFCMMTGTLLACEGNCTCGCKEGKECTCNKTGVEKNCECARPDANVQDELGNLRNNPCLIIVDVNGDRKPNPQKGRYSYKVPSHAGRSRILDVFPVVVTDVNAYPYGVVGQRALFQHN